MKRLLTSLILASWVAVLGAFALPATDTFAVDNFGTNWTTVAGGWIATGGKANANVGGNQFVYWSADAFTDDHYAQATLSGGQYPGVCVRLSSGSNGYCFLRRVSEGNAALLEYNSGADTQLGADFGAVTDSTVVRISINVSTITISYDGVSQGTRPDSTITTGDPGLFSFGTAGTMDDFEAGNVGGGGGPAAPKSLLTLGVGGGN